MEECKKCKKSFKALLKHIVQSKKCEEFYGDELKDLKQESRKKSVALYRNANKEKVKESYQKYNDANKDSIRKK